MKQGKTTIRKVGDKTYEIQTESTLQSIVSDIVSLIVVYLVLSEFLGVSLVFDLFAVALVLLYAVKSFSRSKYLTKDELIKELNHSEKPNSWVVK